MHSSESVRPRNLAIDMFRGWALVVIFINHMPSNEWMLYTTSRFGFSDASEIFVFLSGYAAALSYANSFNRAGLGLTTLAIIYRCAQLFMAHLGLFLALSSICALANELFISPDYIERLNLHYFFDQTSEALLYLVTLRYLPNYFDILPLYMMVMLWVPIVLQLHHLYARFVLLLPILLYVARWWFDLHLNADPHTLRPWFFNPFAWQLLFFSGFAIAAGWIKVPESKCLRVLCSVFLLLAIPLSYQPTYQALPFLQNARNLLEPFLDKTNLGPLRWLHIIVLAIIARSLVQHLPTLLSSLFGLFLITLGQQTLPVFLIGMLLSYVGGIVLDQCGHSGSVLFLVNIGGIALLIASAYLLSWLDSKPWKQIRTTSPMATARASYATNVWKITPHPTILAWSSLLLLAPLATVPWLLSSPNSSEALQVAEAAQSESQSNTDQVIDMNTLNSQPTLDEIRTDDVELNLKISNAEHRAL